jgi:hypothetical protein
MMMPDLAVVAEGELPAGERWVVRAGGTAENYYTFLLTMHPDGHHDEGGFGGPPLHPGRQLNIYTGGDGRGLRRILARTSPLVRRLRLDLATGESRYLLPVGSDPVLGVTFFAALLPWAVDLVSLTGLDADGQILEP